jgi:SAM-dependent methyltransferase
MSAREPDTIERERRDAGVRYNDALTALDRAIVAAAGRPLVREDFDRLATTLIVFLQQITGFVESGDRQVACEAGLQFDRLQQRLATVDELAVRISVMQRALEALRRELADRQPVRDRQPSAIIDRNAANYSTIDNPSAIGSLQFAISDCTYLSFEDHFRGTDASVHARVREYVSIFHDATGVVDLGCGRGEFLAALKAAGITARGVDINGDMAAVARERGLDAVQADALTFLRSVPDESIGGLVAIQVVEHLEPAYLICLLQAAARKMRAGAPIVLETINPACWLAFFSSYIRDFTHVQPVHPETLQYLLRALAFERVEIRYSAPVPDHVKMKTVDLPAEVLASSEPGALALARVGHTLNANAAILNNLMFTHLDYAAVGFRS